MFPRRFAQGLRPTPGKLASRLSKSGATRTMLTRCQEMTRPTTIREPEIAWEWGIQTCVLAAVPRPSKLAIVTQDASSMNKSVGSACKDVHLHAGEDMMEVMMGMGLNVTYLNARGHL